MTPIDTTRLRADAEAARDAGSTLAEAETAYREAAAAYDLAGGGALPPGTPEGAALRDAHGASLRAARDYREARRRFHDACDQHTILALLDEVKGLRAPPVRTLDEWHEDYGDVLWWLIPFCEMPWVGSPLGSDWPGYHTHWTPLAVPASVLALDTAVRGRLREPEEGGTP